MVRTVLLNTLEDVQKLVFEQERNSESGRFHSSYYYRGIPNAEFRLVTKHVERV